MLYKSAENNACKTRLYMIIYKSSLEVAAYIILCFLAPWSSG